MLFLATQGLPNASDLTNILFMLLAYAMHPASLILIFMATGDATINRISHYAALTAAVALLIILYAVVPDILAGRGFAYYSFGIMGLPSFMYLIYYSTHRLSRTSVK